MDLLSDLTPAQEEAVRHVEGPLLVLAGAGSGKTRVITRRVAHLLSLGIPPWQVLAITFTNKAAEEMRGRIASLVQMRGLTVCTFHSFCARMLRAHSDLAGVDADFTIYDDGDSLRAVREALEKCGLDAAQWAPGAIAAAISRAKNELLSPPQYAETADKPLETQAAAVYPVYEKILEHNRALDFDDLLMRVALALRDNAEFRETLQDRYRFLLIDEYQDTNDAQYQIALSIAGERKNICATGDPDQSIYGWRGANLNNILEFEEDFAGCKVIRLERNYRSTPEILAAAGALIRCNRRRKAKELHTENPPGAPVRVVELTTSDEEAKFVAAEIAAAHPGFAKAQPHSAGAEPGGQGVGGTAVFYRLNAMSRALEDALRAQGLPYEIVRGTSFYERQEIRTLVAYLRAIVNPADDLAVERIVNAPARGIGETTVARLQAFAAARGISLLESCRLAGEVEGLKARAAAAVGQFIALFDRLAALDRSQVAPLVHRVIELTKYEDHCRKLGEAEDRLANVEELVNLATKFDEEFAGQAEVASASAAVAAPPVLVAFLERVSLTSDQDDLHEGDDRVHLMTLHAAKGLEFATVYMVGLEDGLLPHVRAQDEGRDIEEERRLCFVGLTRARERLTLTFARYRMHHGKTGRQTPSPFLEELGQGGAIRQSLAAEEGLFEDAGDGAGHGSRRSYYRSRIAPRGSPAVEDVDAETSAIRAAAAATEGPYRLGQLVRHRTYGLGTIVDVFGGGEEAKVCIRFPTVGEKTFVAGFASLEIIERK